MGPHHPLQPGLHLHQQETEPADLGRDSVGLTGLAGNAETRGRGQHSSFSNCWIRGPTNQAWFSHFPFLCRKLIFQELLEVSWALSIFWEKQAAASHRFIKTPLHMHKALGLGSHEASAESHPKAEE